MWPQRETCPPHTRVPCVFECVWEEAKRQALRSLAFLSFLSFLFSPFLAFPFLLVGSLETTKKASWESGQVTYNGSCAWDWRNVAHVFRLQDKSSVVVELWSQLKGERERCAGQVFLADTEPQEGWHRLQANLSTGEAAMGFVYIRVGAPLANSVPAHLPASINLVEVLPEFPAESEHKMEPEPDSRLKPQQVLSLAVSLCDVARVREFLLRGGSVKTPVIIARGVEGSPLEAVCANCPATAKRKKMRIEYDGSAYARLRGCEDAVAIAKLLLHCGAVHDARSVRWLYDNAGQSQGKQALMRLLDGKLYPGGGSKKASEDKAGASVALFSSPSKAESKGWSAARKSPRMGEGPVVLGGTRKHPGRGPRSEAYKKAEEALSRKGKPIPQPPSSDDDADAQQQEDAKDDGAAAPRSASVKGSRLGPHGFAQRPEGESSDLEEESSSTDEETRRRRRAAAAKKAARKHVPPPVSPLPLVPESPSATMDGGSTSMTDADGRSLSVGTLVRAEHSADRLAEEQHQEETPLDDVQEASQVEPEVSMLDLEDELTEITSIVEEETGMDWGVVQTDASMIDLGEEISSHNVGVAADGLPAPLASYSDYLGHTK